VVSATDGTHGSVMLNPEGTLTYVPDADFHGSDSFTYTVVDGEGGEASAVVTVTVSPVNDAPVAVDDSATTGTAATVTVDVLVNDHDVDGDSLAVVAVTQGEFGSVVMNGDGTISYTPEASLEGLDSFTYTIDDDAGGQATATVTVTVGAQPPLVNGGFEEGETGWEFLGDVSVTTTDFGESPAERSYQALLTTKDTAGGKVDEAELEAFLGLDSGALDGVTSGDAKAGSVMRQTVNVVAGQQLVLQYNFLTTEKTPDKNFNDFSFLSISGPDTALAVLLADTYAGGFRETAADYKEATGYRTFVYTFATGGVYTLGFGVSDTKSTRNDSALLIDDVSLQTPAAEPGGIGDAATAGASAAFTSTAVTAGDPLRSGRRLAIDSPATASTLDAPGDASGPAIRGIAVGGGIDSRLLDRILLEEAAETVRSADWAELVDAVIGEI
jgi:VCBS repeat-containing protein